MEENKEQQKQEQQQIDPAKALEDFKVRWDKMKTKEKLETVLAMNMNLAYRLDILAVIVSNIPDVQGMEDLFQGTPNIEE